LWPASAICQQDKIPEKRNEVRDEMLVTFTSVLDEVMKERVVAKSKQNDMEEIE